MALPAFSRHAGAGRGTGNVKSFAGRTPVSIQHLLQNFLAGGGVKQNAGLAPGHAARTGGMPFGSGPRPVMPAAGGGGYAAGGGAGHTMTQTAGPGPTMPVVTPYGVMTAAQAAAMGLSSTPYTSTPGVRQGPAPAPPPAIASGWGWGQPAAPSAPPVRWGWAQ